MTYPKVHSSALGTVLGVPGEQYYLKQIATQNRRTRTLTEEKSKMEETKPVLQKAVFI